MDDVRFQRSREAIKSALCRLLEERALVDITMTALARQACVSRSTVYAHFANVEDVYRETAGDFYAGLSSLNVHLRCEECWCEAGALRPFCIALRDAGNYAAVVADERFLSTLFDRVEEDDPEGGMLAAYRSLGLDGPQMRALFRFQMSGCYAVARSDVPPGDWARIQHLLDTFIRGGMQALRSLRG